VSFFSIEISGKSRSLTPFSSPPCFLFPTIRVLLFFSPTHLRLLFPQILYRASSSSFTGLGEPNRAFVFSIVESLTYFSLIPPFQKVATMPPSQVPLGFFTLPLCSRGSLLESTFLFFSSNLHMGLTCASYTFLSFLSWVRNFSRMRHT